MYKFYNLQTLLRSMFSNLLFQLYAAYRLYMIAFRSLA